MDFKASLSFGMATSIISGERKITADRYKANTCSTTFGLKRPASAF